MSCFGAWFVNFGFDAFTPTASQVPIRVRTHVHKSRIVAHALPIPSCVEFFLARPADETPPKSLPDEESLEARWVHPKELRHYDLRSEEVLEVIGYVARGGPVYPKTALTFEGAPWLM